jgi:hypothetical protein
MCWEGSVAHYCCQCINHTQLLIIQLCCALPCTGLQEQQQRVSMCTSFALQEATAAWRAADAQVTMLLD